MVQILENGNEIDTRPTDNFPTAFFSWKIRKTYESRLVLGAKAGQ